MKTLSILILAIVKTLNALLLLHNAKLVGIAAQLMDPGKMFGAKNQPDFIDPGNMFSKQQSSKLSSSGTTDSVLNNFLLPSDSTCSQGAEILLRRFVRKLFNKIDQLQPNELDEDYIYQSTISYEDYRKMLSSLDAKMTCTNLNNLDRVLSDFVTSAQVDRPSHANLFQTLPLILSLDPFTVEVNSSLYIGYLFLMVIFIGWFLSSYGRCGIWTAYFIAFGLTGFVQFYFNIHQITALNNQEKLDECQNPSYFTRLSSFFNYGNCARELNYSRHPHLTVDNIALIAVQYFSELIFQPVTTFLAKFAKGSQAFLNEFTGWNYLHAPILLAFLILVFALVAIKLLQLFFTSLTSPQSALSTSNGSGSSRKRQRKSIKSPIKSPKYRAINS